MLSLAFGLCLALTATAHGGDTVMAANTRVATITEAQVHDIYTGEQQFINDQRMVPLIYKIGHPLQQDFFATIMHTNEDRMHRSWITRTFRGHGGVPKTLASQREAAALLAVTPGAIAILDADMVPEGSHILFTIPHASGN